MNFRQGVLGSFALAASVSLAACSADINPARDVFVAAGVGGVPAPAPDFVARSRPETLDYVPVGTAREVRPTPARKPEETRAVEAELDTLRTRKEAEAAALRAAASGAPTPAPSAAPPAKPASKQPVRP